MSDDDAETTAQPATVTILATRRTYPAFLFTRNFQEIDARITAAMEAREAGRTIREKLGGARHLRVVDGSAR